MQYWLRRLVPYNWRLVLADWMYQQHIGAGSYFGQLWYDRSVTVLRHTRAFLPYGRKS